MTTIVTVIGARPQFVKAALVSTRLRAQPGIHEVLINTDQHYDLSMAEIFFREMRLPAPDYSLGIGSGTHGAQTGRMLEEIERILLDVRPDWVLVYGDTNTTLAAALAAAKLALPIAHIEAGLRSFNRAMPEEINRVVIDHVASVLFAPTCTAVRNLRREGIEEARIIQSGDVMYDAVRYFTAMAEATSPIIARQGLTPREYLLATIHRQANTDDPDNLSAIFTCLETLAASHLPVIFPLHPRTRAAIDGSRDRLPDLTHITFIKPVGYLDMLMLERHARIIVTDSGGVQKEAFFFRVPCVTLRSDTEWTELIELGWNTLAPPREACRMVAAILSAIDRPGVDGMPYGDGMAIDTIIARLLQPAGLRCHL